MTFLEICKLVRQECGIQGSGVPSSVESQTGILKRVVEWVQDADNLIQSEKPDWKFLWKTFVRDTSVGSDSVTKPVDFGMWNQEAFALNRGTGDGQSLRKMTFEEWRSNNSLKMNEKPYAVCVLPDDNLAFPQPADATHELYGEYWAKPTKLVTNDQVSLIPERFHRIIVCRAKMWFFEDIESIDQWGQAEKEYEGWMKQLKITSLSGQQEAAQSSPDAPMQVRPA